MRNAIKSLFIVTFLTLGIRVSMAEDGTYSSRTISADGLTSEWTFIAPGSQITVPTGTETTDNGIIYAPSGSSKMKFSSSNQFSWSGQSSGYLPVPAGGAGTITMVPKSSSDGRYLQLYVNNTDAGESKRLYSKASSDGQITSDGKRGPQSFAFTASDLTTKDGNTYLHFKDNNTEMKITSFTITLTSGSYTGGGGGGGDDPQPGPGPDPQPGPGPDPQPSGNSIFWRFSGGEAPTAGTSESGTNMTVEFLTSDNSKVFSNESAAYNAAVTDEDLKSQGTKGLKMGANALYLKVTVNGGFKANDVIKICGYNPWKISSTSANNGDINASVATGTSKTDYNVGSVTLSQDYSELYMMRATSSGTCISAIKVERSGSPTPSVSSDATLSALKYYDNGSYVSVPNFSASTLNYDIELPAGYVGGAPSVQATPTHSAANANITQATTIPGTASVLVTAEDGTTTLTYTVTFTRASAAPKVQTATWANILGTAAIDQVNLTITGEVTHGSSLAAITPSFTGQNIDSYTPTGAQDFSNGAVNYTFTSTSNETTTYAVTITEEQLIPVASVSLNKSSVSLQVSNTETLTATVLPANAANKNITWSSDNAAIASVDQTGKVTAVAAGSATITVTTEDGNKTATCTVTVTDGAPVPQTNLSLHVPGVYEENSMGGGYGLDLVMHAQREYEVFYLSNNSGDFITAGSSKYDMDKNGAVGYVLGQGASGTVNAGWVQTVSSSSYSSKAAIAIDEFQCQTSNYLGVSSNSYIELHIKGYDQFSMIANDKSAFTPDSKTGQDKKADQHLKIIIDEEIERSASDMQTTDPSLFRFDITTGEHVIKIMGTGSTANRFRAFSLRVAQEPTVKHFKGNDSTQSVLQTQAISSILYTTKYNNVAGAQINLEWIGAEATGITLSKKSQATGALIDTFMVSGPANCPTGTYHYAVVTSFNGRETARIPGTLRVTSDIKPTSDLNVMVYRDEEMDPITFRYFALDASNVLLSWPHGAPEGISGSGVGNGLYAISGTPTAVVGNYTYEITVEGADTTFTGVIQVREASYGNNAILYLYKNNNAFDKDGVYAYLDNTSRNLIARKTNVSGLRPAEQYAKYKWILISEDADANNPEVIQLIQGGSTLPVLNLKGFTYAKDETRLGWGDPNNGAIDSAATKTQGCNIILEHSSHPIFSRLSRKGDGMEVKILSDYEQNGVMPIAINSMPGVTTCLATAPTRAIDDYYGAGPLETAIHEIPADQRGGGKYICLPLARRVTLSDEGQKLIEGIVDYLLSPTPAVIAAPDLRITRFSVEGKNADINDDEMTIKLEMTVEEFQALDSLKHATPTITLADPQYSHVTPASGEEVSLQYAIFMGKNYEVSDYINRVVYEFKIQLINPQGLDEVYEAGVWVNIFDIYGRKVATTNEDIYQLQLPHGMYIVVTESGQTIKIMK